MSVQSSAIRSRPPAGGVGSSALTIDIHPAPVTPDDWPDSVWLTVGRRLGASPVQLAIMRLMLVEELSNESIAHALGRSRMSVDSQIKRLYKKVGVKTRVGLVKRVYGVAYQGPHS